MQEVCEEIPISVSFADEMQLVSLARVKPCAKTRPEVDISTRWARKKVEWDVGERKQLGFSCEYWRLAQHFPSRHKYCS